MKSKSPPASVAFAIAVFVTLSSSSSRLRRSNHQSSTALSVHAYYAGIPVASSRERAFGWSSSSYNDICHRPDVLLFLPPLHRGREGTTSTSSSRASLLRRRRHRPNRPRRTARFGGTTIDDDDCDVKVDVEMVAPSTMMQSSSSPPSSTTTSTTNEDDDDDDEGRERAIATLVLLTVPLSWGTYAPAVKYMYDVVQPPMPGLVFSAGYYAVASSTLGALSRIRRHASSSMSSMGDDGRDDGGGEGRGNGGSWDDGEEWKGGGEANDGEGITTMTTATITTRGGWELGSYLFVGNGLQVIGLQTVPADRAAFLVQLTTVMVPLLSAMFAGTLYAVPARTWVACLVAFVGVVVMGADESGHVSSATDGDLAGGASATVDYVETISTATAAGHPFGEFSFLDLVSSQEASQGDVLIVLAALAYTMHVVRLGTYAPRTNPLQLASAKASTEAILSVSLCAWLAYVGSDSSSSELPTFVSQMGGGVAEYFSTMTTKFAGAGLLETVRDSSFRASVGAILWTGWITCAYTIYAQSYGQRKVGPSDSNLIYSTQPLFSSLFAYLLLGETLGPYGYVGATLIGMSLWLVLK